MTLGGTPTGALITSTSMTLGWTGTLAVARGGTGSGTASGARTNLGLVINTDVEAWDADLDALAALSSTGMLSRTGSATYSLRTITAGTGVTVTNGDGVSGNPTIAADTALGVPFAAVVKLTDAQIKSLNSAPVTVVPSAGTNIVIAVVSVLYWKSFTGGTYSTTRTVSCRYANDTGGTDISGPIAGTNSTNLQLMRSIGVTGNNTDGTNVSNQAVVVRATTDATGGNSANFLTVIVLYYLFDITRTS